ncbi:hypothetical protein [Mesorhizobium sp. BE184]|uniref:hypothetical protein n=1 Tax=Mesorhizobium sp. BE184 TaxID=2817714 RepID=UPI00286CC127|nr:hypothetical protein [Mesorhizobium sp. BE184]
MSSPESAQSGELREPLQKCHDFVSAWLPGYCADGSVLWTDGRLALNGKKKQKSRAMRPAFLKLFQLLTT